MEKERGPTIQDRETYVPYPKDAVPHIIHNPKNDEKIIVIGDIHGCVIELKELLLKCNYKKGEQTVILAGDLVNGAPFSADVVRYAREEGFLCIKGNHEDHVLYISGEREKMKAKGQDPDEVPDFALQKWTDDLTEEEKNFLRYLPFTITIPKFNTIIVHAGLVPTFDVEQQDLFVMYSIRNLKVEKDENGTLKYIPYQRDGEGSLPWASVWPGPQHVIFGHDAKRKLQEYPFSTGLDTGCVYGGKLTACILPERNFISVDAKQEYKAIAS